jgi:hypothetical protein
MPRFSSSLDDVVQVAPAAFEDAFQQVGPVQVPGLAIGHQRAVEVGHGKAVAHALPEVVGRRGEVDGRDRRHVRRALPARDRAGSGTAVRAGAGAKL